jgi:predicted transcriptional regulator
VPAAIGLLETTSNIAGAQATSSTIATNNQLEKYTRVLSHSGLIRGVVTEGEMGYELTEAGLRFLKEYKEIERDLRQKTKSPQETASPEKY